MEIELKQEDLSNFDTGGGAREIKASITIDSNMPYRRKREAVIFETLAVFLDTELELNREFVQYLTDHITLNLDELDSSGDKNAAAYCRLA